MVSRGFEPYAHLRVRERRPAPGDHNSLPPSNVSQRTILRRYAPYQPWISAAGPGEYDVPSTMGTGPSARLPPHCLDDATSATAAPRLQSPPPPPRLSSPRHRPTLAFASQRRDSPALCTDAPAFTIAGPASRDMWVSSPFPAAGPASYRVPGEFDAIAAAHRSAKAGAVPRSRVKGRSVGTRNDRAPDPWVTSCAPGPGAYHLTRFGDVLPRDDGEGAADPTSEGIGSFLGGRDGTSHAAAAADRRPTGPGPGEYDDNTGVGRRRQPLPTGGPVVTFGVRRTAGGGDPFDTTTSASPGPCAYMTEGEYRAQAKHASRPAPRMARSRFPPLEELDAREGGSAHRRSTGGPQSRLYSKGHLRQTLALQLPSDFDYDFRRGFTLLGRLPAKQTRKAPKHRFDLEEEERSGRAVPSRTQVAFSRRPYDGPAADEALLRGRSAKFVFEASKYHHTTATLHAADDDPGPGSYAPVYRPVEPRVKSALLLAVPAQERRPSAPGPDRYSPRYTTTSQHARARAAPFTRGGFPSAAAATVAVLPGPAEYYNNDAGYAQSVHAATLDGRKGAPFGVRPPARAVYQDAPPRDETTNTNCTYEHVKAWETARQPTVAYTR